MARSKADHTSKTPSPSPAQSPAKVLTPVVFHTLLALSRGPLHGYAISQEVDVASEGRVRMGPGTLYGSLQRMQGSGLVQESSAPETDESPHGDRRRYYALTDAGLEALTSEAHRLSKIVELAPVKALLDR